MRVITAPNYEGEIIESSVFLAGGITGCTEWQDEIIEMLDPFSFGVIFNPRRENFPINDPSASETQIKWEYEFLDKSDVFSMWFCNSDSDQPIALYELGKHLERRAQLGQLDQVIIGVEPGYKREVDVYTQVELVSEELSDKISNNIPDHARNIANAIGSISSEKLSAIFSDESIDKYFDKEN